MMNATVVIPREGSIESFDFEQRVLPPFSDVVVEFIDQVSQTILRDARCKRHPELIALAFWMRKSRMAQLQQGFHERYGQRCLMGRGLVFHMAPSNVDTIFVYSWFLSMLVGNANILRISDKDSEQVSLLLELLAGVLSEEPYGAIRDRVLVVRYGHDDEVTAHFSDHCDMRVIWGGDTTVRHIRSIPISPTAKDLAFADKFSLAVVDAEAYLASDEPEKVAEGFYRDAFTFAQLACSSPRLLAWVGTQSVTTRAQALFWSQLDRLVQSRPPDIPPAGAMDKLVAQCLMAAKDPISVTNDSTGLIHRVHIDAPSQMDPDLHCGMGLFYETALPSLADITGWVDRKSQTLALYGFDRHQVLAYLIEALPRGIDRIVPFGQALDFSEIWDGNDLLVEFCREISVDLQGASTDR